MNVRNKAKAPLVPVQPAHAICFDNDRLRFSMLDYQLSAAKRVHPNAQGIDGTQATRVRDAAKAFWVDTPRLRVGQA
jgi:hypothetical protein